MRCSALLIQLNKLTVEEKSSAVFCVLKTITISAAATENKILRTKNQNLGI